MFNRSSVWPLLVGVATLSWSLALKLQAQETPPATGDIPTVTDAFAPVTQAIAANDLTTAATLLKKMKAEGLQSDQHSRWETLASRVAVRLGDSQWLHEINQGAELSTNADEVVTITASRLLFANRLDEVRSTLQGIKEPMKMSEIPKRRYEELWLKLEQLDNHPQEEARWAGRLVKFVGDWDSVTCQSCHANPKLYGKEITHFDLQNWWVGERYATLLKQSGEAKNAENEARAILAKTPNDTAALIKLGYALRAQGQTEASEKQLRAVPWSKWDDKPYKKPLRLAQFP